MPAPRKYNRTRPFTFYTEENNLEVIKEIAHIERKSAGEKLNELMAQEIERMKIMQPQEVNPLGIHWNETLGQQQAQKQPTEKEKRKTIMDNFETALTELLTITSDMDIDTFSKFKYSIDSRIYKTRNPKYNDSIRLATHPQLQTLSNKPKQGSLNIEHIAGEGAAETEKQEQEYTTLSPADEQEEAVEEEVIE
jgi:hypothetical protein